MFYYNYTHIVHGKPANPQSVPTESCGEGYDEVQVVTVLTESVRQ